ncbi:hypothetical protein AKJ38_03060 [candidate division MSBL1 archaeon SCGC-AAA259I14]|uniref:ABC transmembrane type-1 domain-containing protein n=1 Tax=candidate division MSBL1 archaeon SCGC-AAA259I14 TaxID=1698268 RepID=A0A133UR12_9EURY|nr:hypothetical protein AKJ38_03060 [candidate division MSBL1 archaeon SCGC-AAA259I14]
MRPIFRRIGGVGGGIFLLFLFWFILSLYAGKEALPYPHSTFTYLFFLIREGEIWNPISITLGRVGLGFFLTMLTGTGMGIVAGRTYLGDEVSSFYLPIWMSIPDLIIVFALIMVFGARTLFPSLAAVAIVTPFAATNIRDAMKGLPKSLIEISNSYNASLTQKIREIYIPYLIPSLVATSRIGFAIVWKIVFLAEVFGSASGLGYVVKMAFTVFNLKKLLSLLIIIVAIVIGLEQFLRMVENMVTKWRK